MRSGTTEPQGPIGHIRPIGHIGPICPIGPIRPMKPATPSPLPPSGAEAMPTTFAVLGDGAWGIAIGLLLAQRPEHRVCLWSARAETGRQLQQHRENSRLLPGVRIPETIALTTDVPVAVSGADVWVSAIPTVYLRPTLQRIRAEW